MPYSIILYFQMLFNVKFASHLVDGRKCSHFLANCNSLFKLIFKQSRV